MAEDEDIDERRDIPALFAEITALLEDAHEIAMQGQNPRLEHTAQVDAVEQLEAMVGRMQFLTRTIRRDIR